MKIDGNRPGETASVDRPDRDPAGRPGRADKGGAGPDRVDLSPQAALVAEAFQASQRVPDVRADAVARARELVRQGKVGNDPGRLADRILDSLLEP
jgi:flagellar biosynthesis anti-sigma factor FlgM